MPAVGWLPLSVGPAPVAETRSVHPARKARIVPVNTASPVEDGNENTDPHPTYPSSVGTCSGAEARLRAWVEGLLAAGLCRRLPDGRAVLVCSQADLARRLGLSPSSGSISKRLTALERLGVLVGRDPVVFDLGAGTSTVSPPAGAVREGPLPLRSSVASTEDPASVATSATSSGDLDRLAVVVELLHRVCVLERTDLLDRVLAVLASPLLLDAAAPPERPPRALGGAVRAAPAPSLPSPSQRDDSSLLSVPLLPHSLLPHSPPGPLPGPLPGPRQGADPAPALVLPEVAGSAAGGRRPDRYRFRHTPDAALRLQALAPLLEDCARRGLPGVGSPSGLLEAFDGYTLEQITCGVEFVRSQLASASPLRSPVGLLAHMARTGDLALVEHVPTMPRSDPYVERPPAEEPPGEWLARMGALMRTGEPEQP